MILFIDDEKRSVDSYVLEMKLSGFYILYVSNIDNAWSVLQENSRNIELIILDVMMPPGIIFESIITESGLMTGVHFYKKVRENLPECPVIIFTNISDRQILQNFMEENNCWFIKKGVIAPFPSPMPPVAHVERLGLYPQG
jgi:DNA-binding NtrC family response regulator